MKCYADLADQIVKAGRHVQHDIGLFKPRATKMLIEKTFFDKRVTCCMCFI